MLDKQYTHLLRHTDTLSQLRPSGYYLSIVAYSYPVATQILQGALVLYRMNRSDMLWKTKEESSSRVAENI